MKTARPLRVARPRRSVGIAGLALVGLLVALPAQADYRADFDRALQALAREDFAEAAELVRSALGQREAAEARRSEVEGVGSSAYTPHLVLGLAAGGVGNCAMVGRAYVVTVVQRVAPVYEAERFARLGALRDNCGAEALQAPPKQLVAADELAAALVAFSRLEDLRDEGPAVRELLDEHPEWRANWQEARRSVDFSHNLLLLSFQGAAGEQELDSAANVARRARAGFRRVEKLLGDAAVERANRTIWGAQDRVQEIEVEQRRLGGVWQREDDLVTRFRGAGTLLSEAQRALQEAAGRDRVSSAVQAIELAADADRGFLDVLEGARGLRPEPADTTSVPADSDVADVDEEGESTSDALARSSLDRDESAAAADDTSTTSVVEDSRSERIAPVDLEPVHPGGPPRVLVLAAEAYFAGRFEEAVELLEPAVELDDERAARDRDLFLTAAYHALSRIAADADVAASALEQAQATARALLDREPDFTPPEAFFPPEVVALFESP